MPSDSRQKQPTDVPRHSGFEDWPVADYLGLLWPDVSRRRLEELFAAGRVRSGGRPVGMRRTVGESSDLVVEGGIDADARVFLGAPGPGEGIAILHEDDRLIAVSKPSGLPVVPDRGNSQGSVFGALVRRELEERGSKPPERWFRPRIVHRIDRLTSGLVLVAKTPDAERRLGAAFEARRVKKEYFAVLGGAVRAARVTVNSPVVPGRKGKMRAEADGPPALTDFDVVERLGSWTVVAAHPLTGRTHQIRVHAWAMGHPLAIDPLYNARGEALEGLAPHRLTLHASRCELPEEWGPPRTFECPLAGDLAALVEALRRRGTMLWMSPSGGG